MRNDFGLRPRPKLKAGGRVGKQLGGVGAPVAPAGGVGSVARRDMRSGYYPNDMGMQGGAMYKKGGSIKKKKKQGYKAKKDESLADRFGKGKGTKKEREKFAHKNSAREQTTRGGTSKRNPYRGCAAAAGAMPLNGTLAALPRDTCGTD